MCRIRERLEEPLNAGLAEMFEYNRWANARLIAACRDVDTAVLDAHVDGVSGTVRSLFTHLVGGEQTFALRTKGRQNEGEWNRSSPFPGFDELAHAAQSTGTELIAIAGGLEGDETAVLPWQDKQFEFPVRFFLVHVLEHGVEHRTEIKLALGQLGIETPDLDRWIYAQEMGYGKEL